jgi:DNA-binding LacI/PurR family transcriptional regulator
VIVCSNQNMFGALRAVKEVGIKSPTELSFIGADESLA